MLARHHPILLSPPLRQQPVRAPSSGPTGCRRPPCTPKTPFLYLTSALKPTHFRPDGFPSTAPVPRFPPTPGPCCLPLDASRAGECLSHPPARLGSPCRSPSLYGPQLISLPLAHCCTPRSRPCLTLWHHLAPPSPNHLAVSARGSLPVSPCIVPWAWAHRLWARPVIFERILLVRIDNTSNNLAPQLKRPHHFPHNLTVCALGQFIFRPFPASWRAMP